jgi:hypothetical protein
MKVSFYRVLNSSLPEPYKGLTTDILYFTDKGYVYPEGNSIPIDMFDPEIIEPFLQSINETCAKTTINNDTMIKLPVDFESDSFHETLKLNKDLLSYLHKIKYASIKGTATQFAWTRQQAKEKLEMLERLNILGRYASFFIINTEIKCMLEMELSK